ncbi:MAG: four-carbon acid sugar kinase family protein [Acetobacteraceae bacterium]
MTVVRLVADDLTGALDAAVQFALDVPGFPVLLAPDAGAGDIEPDASAAISTGSRELEPAAAASLPPTAPFLADADIAFLKVDSLLRGNWPVELARVLAALPGRTCIFAPAFPAQRRCTERGRQIAPGPDGQMHVLPVIPHAALGAVGLRAILVPAGTLPHADPGSVLICDAVCDADLNALVVAAARAIDGRVLWCGSAGLARALSGCPPPAITLDASPPLVIVGSDHAVARGQIAALPSQAAIVVAPGSDATGAIARIDRTIGRVPCIISFHHLGGLSRPAASGTIQRRLAAILPHLRLPVRLVVIGGETLSLVCQVVGAEALLLEGEWLPGVPRSRIAGGIWHGVSLLSRSGAFGEADFFRRLFGASVRHQASDAAATQTCLSTGCSKFYH